MTDFGSILYVHTQSGKNFRVHPDGNIQRLDMDHNPSGEWKMQGIIGVRYTLLHHMIKFGTPELLVDDGKPRVWTYANGKPRYRLVDLDHGTTRVWGDGITEIRAVPVDPETAVMKAYAGFHDRAGTPEFKAHLQRVLGK